MFWRMAGLSATSPQMVQVEDCGSGYSWSNWGVESLLDRDTFTLEELLDEDELIQECKSLNTRLINFLRGKSQIQLLLQYVVEEPPEGADTKRALKFPFIACEIFTCEIEVICRTMVEDEELMDLLFSFLDSDRPHGTLLAGYFSKVVISLLMRKTTAVMRYLQVHQEVLNKLVDFVAITSIMEVLIRLVGADDSIRAFHEDSLHWLADTNLLELLVDKLSPPNSSETHANAAEALSAVSRLSQSALAAKLSSPSFIGKLFHHALEDPDSKSALIHSLTVCISLLDPKKYVLLGRGQHIPDSLSSTTSPDVIEGMLQRLGDLLKLLNISEEENILPTTYGELRPPLGTHRLKIIEFLAVLLETNSEEARKELVQLGAIQTVLKLFFEYPFNNLLHHHVENIINSCIESNSKLLINHLLSECDLVNRILEADANPFAPLQSKPTYPAPGKASPRLGNIGHLTRIANRMVQAANDNLDIQAHLQGIAAWSEWQENTLFNRNSIENVCHWTCGRPTSMRVRPADSDEDDFRDKDYDITSMSPNLDLRYGILDSEDADEDVFFDDESAEVVISSLQLGEEHDSGRAKDSYLSGANWFTFSEERSSQQCVVSTSTSDLQDRQPSHNTSSSNSSGNDVIGEDGGLSDTATSEDTALTDGCKKEFGSETLRVNGDVGSPLGGVALSNNICEEDLQNSEASIMTSCRSVKEKDVCVETVTDASACSNHGGGNSELQGGQTGTSLFDEAVQYGGVDSEATAKAMEHALREGIVGEAGPIHPVKHPLQTELESQSSDMVGDYAYSDVNYWRSDFNPSLTEVESL